ncbi:MAG: trypsin [Ignavibacteria bacterium CG22_combo_CG10-13_8_21_14_all_37_15]|nr:MAG: trypsin [Ignavibacteria bacterium CG22_combo_CG10-13_8_21_14_all_37_15]
MKKKKIVGVFALLTVGVLFSAIMVSGFGWAYPDLSDIKLGASKPPVNLNADASAFNQAFVEVAEKVTPSIVQISVVAKVDQKELQGQNPFFQFHDFGTPMPKEQEGSGSGIIISEDGYILTNNHVVENATKVTVGLHDKRSIEAKVIGTDPLTDLAVIKINAKDLTVAYLGNSDELKVGQWVMAIGNPLALASTVTAGIVSALNRGRLGLLKDQAYGVENFIQTDAAINPGNSGGALVDLSGAVIGVNSAIAAARTGTYIGYSFAIPINMAKSVAQDLIAHGKISRGYIGVQIREVDESLALSLGMDKPTGVIIQKIVEGGSASNEDVKEGDVILKIDNTVVDQANQLQSYVASKTAGAKIKLTIFRDGKTIERSVTLKPREEDKTEAAENVTPKGNEVDESPSKVVSFDDIGLTVKNLTAQEKETYKVAGGVMISEVKEYSRASNQGLQPDLVITKADKKEIKSVAEFKKIIESKKGSAVFLVVNDKKGDSFFVGLKIPE